VQTKASGGVRPNYSRPAPAAAPSAPATEQVQFAAGDRRVAAGSHRRNEAGFPASAIFENDKARPRPRIRVLKKWTRDDVFEFPHVNLQGVDHFKALMCEQLQEGLRGHEQSVFRWFGWNELSRRPGAAWSRRCGSMASCSASSPEGVGIVSIGATGGSGAKTEPTAAPVIN
jgi:hypothetical protein